jgi:plastocyanin
MCRESLVRGGLATIAAAILLALTGAAPASAGEPILHPATYPGMTTYSCRTDAIDIHPGQNINDFRTTKVCPHPEVVKGPGSADIFNAGSNAQGFITRFKPSMVELKPSGKLVTPSVWDLHLHHVVWIVHGNPTFASGEEKTEAMLPQGYGGLVGATENWGVNQMIHNLNQSDNRQVYLTWEIDWVPQTTPARTDIRPANTRWMDVAGAPQIYPVFDAEKGFDRDGDGKYTFPDEVPTDPSEPGYEERQNISPSRQWTIQNPQGATLVFGAGHLHPGGESVDLRVARDGPDAGTVDGDDPSEVKDLFKSTAKYYEPAGAVSWDVAMRATPRDWRISLKQGDTVSINVTYDVRKASWYESMGILPVVWVPGHPDPAARDPFDDAAAVKQMYDEGGTLTHRRLPENIDKRARKDLGLPNPKKLKSKGKVPQSGIDIRGFYYQQGGFTATRGFPRGLMRPPVIKSGQTVTFTNLDALPDQTNEEQAWHSITSCRLPCNKDSGIGYPLANGPIKFDSGQLGYGKGLWSSGVTTGSNTWTTPPLTYRKNKKGKKTTTYTYFCRIHPLMRGSIRVRK